jgi:hypothetical protein
VSEKPTGKQLLGLVGNPDVYAVQHEDGSWHPVRERLTAKVIRAHRAGEVTVGTYIVKPPDQARTLVFDIDAQSEDEQEQMLSAVLDVLAKLRTEVGGALTHAVEFSGRKGYHVWVVSDDYVDAEVLYRLGRGIREEAGYPAMEVFPKQTHVRDLGNLVKLPGGVHRVTGKANDFITHGHSLEGKDPTPSHVLETLAELYPEVGLRKRKGAAPDVIEYPCVHDIQSGVKEGGRNIHLFHLAVMLRRWSITDDNVEAIVRRANEQSPDGPLDDTELEGILENSRYSGPICNQLDDSVHCGEQCIMARHSGLYTRAGALKWAGVGEVVTVEVADRTETGVELSHPDIVQGRAVLSEAARKKGAKRGD